MSADGIKYDPRRMTAFPAMEPPTTGAHLQQFLCALQWVKQGLPQFSDLVKTLHEFMERFLERAEKRTRQSVSRVSLSALRFASNEKAGFENCKQALANQVTLLHRDRRKRPCVYTDASKTVWSGIVTQVPYSDLSQSHSQQRHDALAFLSGKFNSTQLGWSILEKEAFAVLATLKRMHWLVASLDGFDLQTDHNNLIYRFDPLSVVVNFRNSRSIGDIFTQITPMGCLFKYL